MAKEAFGTRVRDAKTGQFLPNGCFHPDDQSVAAQSALEPISDAQAS